MKLVCPLTRYYPKTYFQNLKFNGDGPIFYLGGPILGGGNWQERAIQIFKEQAPKNSVIVSPTKYAYPHPFALHSVVTTEDLKDFTNRLAWEQHYMHLASTEGALLFWLGLEDPLNPRQDGNPYAMVTRDEVAMWRTFLKLSPHLKVVFGIEDGFPGKAEIEWMLNHYLNQPDFNQMVQVQHSLESTVSKAVELALNK